MMRCRRFETALCRAGGAVPATRKGRAMLRHADRCARCAAVLRAESMLGTALRDAPEPVVPPGLEQRVLGRALPAGGRRRGRSRYVWPWAAVGTAAAAGALAIALVRVMPTKPAPGSTRVPQVALQLHQTRQVGFVFHVRHRLRNVRIVIRLPKGVSVVGRGARRVVWHVDLQRGDNLLKLPLLARTRGGGMVRAEVDVAGLSAPVARAALMTRTMPAGGSVNSRGNSSGA